MPTGVRHERPDTGACHLFFGVFPPPPVREAMAATVERLREMAPVRARWSDPRRYHVTVQFLGHFDADQSPPMPALREAALSLRVPRFQLHVDTTGSFGRGRVGWLGCRVIPPELIALWEALGQALDTHGIARDASRSYTPHVTVLRDARQAWPVTTFDPIAWPVSELVLARSWIGRGDPYESLEAWPLG